MRALSILAIWMALGFFPTIFGRDPDEALLFTLFVIGGFFYFLPSTIAFIRVHRYRWIILLVNMFVGWTGLGLLVLFAWSIWPKNSALNPPQEHSLYADLSDDAPAPAYQGRRGGAVLAIIATVLLLFVGGMGYWAWQNNLAPSLRPAQQANAPEALPSQPSLEVEQPAPPPPVQAAAPKEIPPELQAPTTVEIAVSEPPPPLAGETLSFSDVTWAEQPSGRDFERRYPRRALQRGIGGRVMLDCHVQAEGRLGCSVQSEEPQGHGFGDAGLRLAREYQASPDHPAGQRVRVPIIFGVADER